MTTRIPRPRIPSAGEIVAPIERVETAVIAVIPSVLQTLGLPVPPNIVGPVGIIRQIAGQLPTPPQLPDVPKLPGLNSG